MEQATRLYMCWLNIDRCVLLDKIHANKSPELLHDAATNFRKLTEHINNRGKFLHHATQTPYHQQQNNKKPKAKRTNTQPRIIIILNHTLNPNLLTQPHSLIS